MLNKLGLSMIKFGLSLLLIITILWGSVSIGYWTTLIENLNIYGYLFLIVVSISLVSQKIKCFIKKMIGCLYKYWYLTILILLFYQLLIILSNSVLVTADTTAIIENIRGVGNLNYFSSFPNNFLYGLYVKGLYSLFGMKYLVLVQEIINILILDIGIILFSKTIGKQLSSNIASIYFVLSIAFIGIHPQFLSTYTDYWSYFISALVSLLLIRILAVDVKIIDYVALSIIIGIGYLIRPTILNFAVALFLTLLLSMTVKLDKKMMVKISKGLLAIIFGISIFSGLIFAVKQTDILSFKNGYDKNMAYYFDLGLTSTGSAHAELPEKAVNQDSPNKVVEPLINKDIQTRLKKYSINQSITKFRIAFQEGNLGWRIEQPLSFLKFQENKITSALINSKFGMKIRTYLFFQGNNFINLDSYLQVMWLIIITGIALQFFQTIVKKNYSVINLFLSLSILGAFMYLMIFEAGRSRYLISFLPILILQSSLGFHSLKGE